MLPNTEQSKSLIRWFLTYLGGTATGYLTAKNWLTAEQLAQVASFFSSETLVTLLGSIGVAVWGMAVHTKANTVAVVDAMPEIAGVIPKSTQDGKALAVAVSSATVVPSGTPQASAIASTR